MSETPDPEMAEFAAALDAMTAAARQRDAEAAQAAVYREIWLAGWNACAKSMGRSPRPSRPRGGRERHLSAVPVA